MKKGLALAIGVAVVIGMSYGGSLNAAEKVLICHARGNGDAHVISISEHAVDKHLDHGDSLEAAEGLEPGDSCEAPGRVETPEEE